MNKFFLSNFFAILLSTILTLLLSLCIPEGEREVCYYSAYTINDNKRMPILDYQNNWAARDCHGTEIEGSVYYIRSVNPPGS